MATKKNSKPKGKSKDTTSTKATYEALEIDDVLYQTTLPEWFKHRKTWKPQEEGVIASQIAGIVRDIFIKEGDSVDIGTRLLVLEAMKMYNEILSPVVGVVEAVSVQPNCNIPKGTVMIKIKPNPEKGEKKE
ncbi:MAG: acetyl-CoA carboxylase biotin carboxyl carrier protein subunit [Bacteroidales bacterium]|jgi:biotin carboxyl carrier protein|nr:acetyl-CoA carboxylase biotin carboxyl carrier protein subunit [Bacteroidales bacterium]